MAEELRLALSLLGSLAVGAVVLHGIWTVRKTSLEERKQAEQQKQQEKPEIDEEEQEVQALKIKQMEIDFSDFDQNNDQDGLPVVDMNVDSIYDKSKASTAQTPSSAKEGDDNHQDGMKSFLSHARQLEKNPDIEIDSSHNENSDEQAPVQQSAFTENPFSDSEVTGLETIADETANNRAEDISIIDTSRAEDDDSLIVEGFSAFGNTREDDVDTQHVGGFSSDLDKSLNEAQRPTINTEPSSSTASASHSDSASQAASQVAKDEQTVPKQEVLILFVDKPTGEMIDGAKLLPLLLTLGFKFGEMDFFHRHEQSSGHGEILFSLANMYNPGTFDIDHMEQVSTRGLSIFMTLPNAGEALQTFNMMHNAAKKIADEFGARVLDAERQPLDVVRVRNYVDKIRKF